MVKEVVVNMNTVSNLLTFQTEQTRAVLQYDDEEGYCISVTDIQSNFNITRGYGFGYSGFKSALKQMEDSIGLSFKLMRQMLKYKEEK